jgi:hypothetical protein
MDRDVTVPSQLIGLELYERFSFISTGHVDQFILAEWRMLKNLFYLTGYFDQFISPPVQV